MKEQLEQLFSGVQLSQNQAYESIVGILSGKYSDAEIASFLTVYRMRSVSPAEMIGFRRAMLEYANALSFDQEHRIDIVGTGGDGKNSFNISTLSCFVVAGAGYYVTKHGNYGVSSISGSSNVLQELGYVFIDQQDELQRQLDRAGICFLHAPLFHPSMKHVASVRRALKIRTLFNLLGPVVNPSRPSHFLLGIYSPEVAELYKTVLTDDGIEFNIVHSTDGYDEISLTSTAMIWDRKSRLIIEPGELGFSKWSERDLYGGESVEEASQIFLRVLEGEGTEAQNQVVVANAATAIKLLDQELSYEESVAKALESLSSGNALKKLHLLVK